MSPPPRATLRPRFALMSFTCLEVQPRRGPPPASIMAAWSTAHKRSWWCGVVPHHESHVATAQAGKPWEPLACWCSHSVPCVVQAADAALHTHMACCLACAEPSGLH